MVLPSGAKNFHYDASSGGPVDTKGQDPSRGMLYEYLVYHNEFLDYVGKIDPGFDWAADKTKDETNEKLSKWPFTIFLQGDEDKGVDKDVCVSVSSSRGLASKAILFMAKGQDHLFGRTCFLEDDGPGMDEIRLATRMLENAVDTALNRT